MDRPVLERQKTEVRQGKKTYLSIRGGNGGGQAAGWTDRLLRNLMPDDRKTIALAQGALLTPQAGTAATSEGATNAKSLASAAPGKGKGKAETNGCAAHANKVSFLGFWLEHRPQNAKKQKYGKETPFKKNRAIILVFAPGAWLSLFHRGGV